MKDRQTVFTIWKRFPSEARKIVCGYKWFRALGIDYRAIRDDTLDWIDPTKREYRIGS